MVRSFISTLELGASVIFTIGIALKRVEDQIKKNTQVLEKIFAEGLRLPDEVKPAAASSCCGLAELRPYLDTTLSLLEQQLIALRKPQPVLVQEGSTGSVTTDAIPERDNLGVFEGLPVIGPAITYGRAALLPTQINAQYQKIIRDITISAGVIKDEQSSAQGAGGEVAGVKTAVKEQDVIATVKKITTDTGMERNQAAMLIKQLYGTGMGLQKALDFAPVAATFSVGQDAAIGDTTRLISELQSHPKITGPAELKRALEFIVSQRKGTGEDAAAPLSDTQHQQLDAALKVPQVEGATSILDGDMKARRDTSERHLSEASDSVDNAMRSWGESVQPLTDGLAIVVKDTANAFTEAPSAVKWLTVGMVALGTTFLALKGRIAVRSLLDSVRKRFKSASMLEATAEDGLASSTGPTNAFELHDPLNVFVVNARDIGCCQGKGKGKGKGKDKGKNKEGKQGRSTQDKAPQSKTPSAQPPTRSPSEPTPDSPQPPTKPSVPGNPGRTMGKIGAAIKEVRGPAMLEAGFKTVATFVTADTAEEKAEGYGAAAGGLVGTVLGGVLGAFVPLIGPPIGSLLGGMAGDAIGGWLGKRMVSSGEEPVAATKPTDNGQVVAAQPGDVVRSLVKAAPAPEIPLALANAGSALAPSPQVNQQFTFTPNMPITVQGSVCDPTQLAQNLQAMVRRELEELMRMATSRQLSDVPHVYV